MFAIKGTSVYPDATFTLRLAFGPVKGYEENGKAIPAWTNFGGAFAHEIAHKGQEFYDLPDSWHAARENLNLNTPFNFVCTADIIGGNSGSPVINRDAELVGVIFDGNIQSLTADFFYSDQIARAVSVHASSIRDECRNCSGSSLPIARQCSRKRSRREALSTIRLASSAPAEAAVFRVPLGRRSARTVHG